MGDTYFDTYLDALYLDVDKKGFGVIKFLEYKKGFGVIKFLELLLED